MLCELPSFGRCCFCLPLRIGVLVFGYLNVLFGAFMVGMFSYKVHYTVADNSSYHMNPEWIYHGVITDMPAEGCIAFYCIEIVFNLLFLYGAHKKILVYIKTFYYFLITTTVAIFVLEIYEISKYPYLGYIIEMGTISFAGLCIQVYLIFLVRSLINKLPVTGGNVFENQLQQIVTGETQLEGNGVYERTTRQILSKQTDTIDDTIKVLRL